MGWFKRRADDDIDDDVPLSAVLGVRELEPDEWVRPTFAPKPPDLERAAGIAVAEPPLVTASLSWSDAPPDEAGVFWWAPVGIEASPRLVVVVDFGGRLSVRTQNGSGSTYVAVGALARRWAGPVAIPRDVALEDLVL